MEKSARSQSVCTHIVDVVVVGLEWDTDYAGRKRSLLRQATTDSDRTRVRSVDPRDDLPGVIELIADVAKLDGVPNDPWMHVLRTRLDVPGLDPARYRWVAEAGSTPTVVAQALLVRSIGDTKADLDVVVHPSYRRRGIGSAMLDQVLRRAREIGVKRLSLFAREDDPATNAFLRRRGFAPDGVYTEMRLPAEVPVDRPGTPPGYQIRCFNTIGDIDILVEAMNNCYAGLWAIEPRQKTNSRRGSPTGRRTGRSSRSGRSETSPSSSEPRSGRR
jgi:ribosomal protein S18 acetylase RimI-like enzyme